MRISIVYTSNGPRKAFIDNKKAIKEYERLRDLDDYVDYSVMELPVEDRPHNQPLNVDRLHPAESKGKSYDEIQKGYRDYLRSHRG